MTIKNTYKQISYIKTRKEYNLNKLLNNDIQLEDYAKSLNSYLRQVKNLEIGKELYPNIWLELIDFKSLLKDEITSINKMLNKKIEIKNVRVDRNLRIRYIEEK